MESENSQLTVAEEQPKTKNSRKRARPPPLPEEVIQVIRSFASKQVEQPETQNGYVSFNSPALDAYKQWYTEKYDGQVELDTFGPPLPLYTNILAGQIDAIATHGQFQWPIMVKQIYHPPNSTQKSIQDIAESRKNFYLEKDENGWLVKEGTKVWFACQNVMLMHRFNSMQLVVYNPGKRDIIVVVVTLEKCAYESAFAQLKTHLNV